MKNAKFVIISVIFTLITFNFAFFHNYKFIVNAKNETNNLTSAKAMAVMEVSTGRILYSKNEEEKLPMASTTKIITTIVAIENNDNLEKIVEIENDCVGIEGTSIYLKAGEHLTIEELLYGLMLRSGNDAAVAIAKATSGSVENFMILANNFCKNIGANDTNLTNPHGLPDDNHYTTAKDLALISSYALKNEKFAKIVGSKQKIISNELSHGKKRILNNKNKLLKNMDNATGIKTGYTKKAGRCFVGSAQKDGMELVCVLLNCLPMFEECKLLLEKGFNEFKMVEVLKGDEVLGEINVTGSNNTSVKYAVKVDAVVPLKINEIDSIDIVYDLPSKISAPHDKSEPIGKFDIYASKNLIFSNKIYIIENVESKKQNMGENIIKDFVHLL